MPRRENREDGSGDIREHWPTPRRYNEYGVDDFGGRDDQRQTAGCDAEEGGLPPTAPCIGEDSDDADCLSPGVLRSGGRWLLAAGSAEGVCRG